MTATTDTASAATERVVGRNRQLFKFLIQKASLRADKLRHQHSSFSINLGLMNVLSQSKTSRNA